MPVNLVAGFENGEIAYNMLALVFGDKTGNQVLDGSTEKGRPSINRALDLPMWVNPDDGFVVAANNQGSSYSRPVPGTVRSHHLTYKLGSLTRGNGEKVQAIDMERLLLNDVTDSFATTLLQHLKLTSIFR